MSAQEQMNPSRAEQRKQRLLEAEREVAREEAEALKLTEDQRLALLQPFTSVKAEFTDLDGLRWTQTALRCHQPPNLRRSSHVSGSASPPTHFFSSPTSASASPDSKTFVVLTNSDLMTSFSGEDTIRPSARSRPSFSSPLLSLSLYSPRTTKVSKKSAARQVISVDDLRGHRSGTRTRSPVKGLFLGTPEQDSPTASPSRIPPSPQTATTRTTATPIVLHEQGLSLSEEGAVGAGPPGLARAPTYSLVPPAPLTSQLLSTPLPSISISPPDTTCASDFNAGGSQPVALYDTRNPAAYGYPHRDAPSPTPDHPPSIYRAAASAFRSTPSLLASPSNTMDMSSSVGGQLATPPPATQSRQSPRTRLQALLHDDTRSQSTIRGFDFPLPPRSPPGLQVPASSTAPAARAWSPPVAGAAPGTAHGPSSSCSSFSSPSLITGTRPSSPRGMDETPQQQQQDVEMELEEEDITSLTPLDLSYRYAPPDVTYGYESEGEDDITPTPSPTFSPGELHSSCGGSGTAAPATSTVNVTAPLGSRWHRPWMTSS